jgi:hypothetical protein
MIGHCHRSQCLFDFQDFKAGIRLFARFNATMTATTNNHACLSQPSPKKKRINDYIWTIDPQLSNPL